MSATRRKSGRKTAPPENSRQTGGRDGHGRFTRGTSGNPAARFRPGQSGNAGGRPRGSYSILGLFTEALQAQGVNAVIVQKIQDHLRNDRRFLAILELAARINREIGLGSDEGPRGVVIHIHTNLKPGELRRRHEQEQREDKRDSAVVRGARG